MRDVRELSLRCYVMNERFYRAIQGSSYHINHEGFLICALCNACETIDYTILWRRGFPTSTICLPFGKERTC